GHFPRVSEPELGPELNDSRSDALHAAADHAEGRGTDVEIHRARVRIKVFQEVEELRAELKGAVLPETDGFIDREIHILDSRQAHRIGARRGAEAAERRLRECRGVKPMRPGPLIAG